MEPSSGILFTIFYFLFCLGFVYQAKEFIGFGLSPEILLGLGDWVGAEEITFIEFQLRKTSGTLVLYALLPLGYVAGYSYATVSLDHYSTDYAAFFSDVSWAWYLLVGSVTAVAGATTLAYYWSLNAWQSHPITKKLKVYASENWNSLRADINTEFRRIDKIVVETNPLERVVVTDNWILVLGPLPWNFHLSHQSDASLKLLQSDNHSISVEGELGGTQFLTIQVDCRKAGVSEFKFRINSLEYQNLQDRLSGPIQNIQNVQVYKTVSERFVDVFKEQVLENDKVEVDDELESCIGCMQATSNVKLVRVCESSEGGGRGENPCVSCYCRPMWCIDCLAKWFASRQDQSNPESWLGSKCPCPTCRNKFCVLDVRMIL